MSSRRILVTGAAGFIGFHTTQQLRSQGHTVFGVDNFNNYYSTDLKHARSALLKEVGVEVEPMDVAEPGRIRDVIEREAITDVVHLAAQAGVRYSLKHPEVYVRSNIDGFLQILEAVRFNPHVHLVYASSSSVYGLNKKVPFSIDDRVDSQANFYGVTKRSNELMAATYHYLYKISAVGLRFFTVYGPWGRPDMAYYLFARAIAEGRTIDLYNYGNMQRDFTYIDDIVSGIVPALDLKGGNYLFNLGNEKPEALRYLVELLEQESGKKAAVNLLPMPAGEIEATYADITLSKQMLSFSPKTSLDKGISSFMKWFRENPRFVS